MCISKSLIWIILVWGSCNLWNANFSPRDSSDEHGCSLVVLGKGYTKIAPPIEVDLRKRDIVFIYLWRWPHLLFACWRKKTFFHVSENAIHNNKINRYKMRRRSTGVNSNSQQVKVTTWFEIQCYAHRKHKRSELALIWHWKKLIWMTLTFLLECNFISR